MNPVRAFVPAILVKGIRVNHITDFVCGWRILKIRYLGKVERLIVAQTNNIKHFCLVAAALPARCGTPSCVFRDFQLDEITAYLFPADERTVRGTGERDEGNFFCATEVCVTEVCATEVCATEVCATEVCATEVCATEVCATEVCATEVCVTEVCVTEVCVTEVCATEVCATEVCATEVCATEVCATEVCATEVCATEVCVTEVCVTEVCATEVCATEVCATEVCAILDRLNQRVLDGVVLFFVLEQDRAYQTVLDLDFNFSAHYSPFKNSTLYFGYLTRQSV